MIAKAGLQGDADTVDYEALERIPYASMGAKIKGQPQSVVVLNRADAGRLYWTSPDRRGVVTQEGRIVETLGLSYAMRVVRFMKPDPLTGGWRDGDETMISLDLPRLGYYDVVVRCTVLRRGTESVELRPGKTVNAEHVEERCRAPAVDWSFTNDHWFTGTGTGTGPVKSIQHLTPDFPPMVLTVVKPYNGS